MFETCEDKAQRRHVTGTERTEEFMLGAQKTLAICQKHGIRKAILAKYSPSCDCRGITGRLLQENGIEVINVF